MNNKRPKNSNIQKKNKRSTFLMYGAFILSIIAINFYFGSGGGMFQTTKPITTNEFYNFLRGGDVKKVLIVNRKEVQVFLNEEALNKPPHKKQSGKGFLSISSEVPQYEFEFGDLQNFENQINVIKKEQKLNTVIEYYTEKNIFSNIVLSILPFLIIIGIWMFIMRRVSGGGGGPGGQIFNIGKSRAKLFDENDSVKTTFSDIAGLEGAKEEVQEIVEFLKNPSKYTALGGKIPKGALLVGPPGTGKTLLAKAVAGEAKVPFFSLSGSDFVEMFVGVGASRVRDLFRQAKDKSPAIIFIDEIDAIGRARGKNNFAGSNDERENTLNQLLTEMDGFGTDSNVIVLAATNRADVLDKALMRAGRFDRQIHVDLPDLRERMQIFKVHLKPIKASKDLDIDFLARQTPGFSGADIANVCNEAALVAARRDKLTVDKQDFLDAVDRIIGGLEKRSKVITPSEKRTIAFHEAGHATVSWLLEHAAPLVKVTIVPRGQSLGAAWYLPEERQIIRTDQILDEMCATLGGRAAEKITFGAISTGALSDLEKITKQARAMVMVYGLNNRIGNLTYYDSSGQSEYGFTKPYSEDTARVIDGEISNIIETQYQRAIEILTEHKEKLVKLAELLIEREVIFKDDLEAIFGKRPFDKSDPVEEKIETSTVGTEEQQKDGNQVSHAD